MTPMGQRHTGCLVVLTLLAWGARTALGQPRVTNRGFEADRYTRQPGYADQNGGTITGWTYCGHVGVNPVRLDTDGEKAASPFADNARVPQGRQVLFMQNKATVAQKVAGFRQGKRYRLEFRENARAYNRSTTFPKLTVKLGGETVVSPHLIEPVCAANQRDLPYARVVSDLFVAPADGVYELVFETLNARGVSVLIDDVKIAEAGNEGGMKEERR